MSNKKKVSLSGFVLFLVFLLVLKLFFVEAYNIPSPSMEPTLIRGDFILTNKLVYKFADPRRGDIVNFIFPHPERFGKGLVNTPILREFENVIYVKRVIGVPGDRVAFRNGRLILNGKPLKYEKVRESGNFTVYYEYLPRKNGVVKHLVQYQTRGELDFTNRLGRYGVLSRVIPPQSCLKATFVCDTFGCVSVCTEIRVPKGYYFVMGDNRDHSDDSRFWGFVRRDFILSTPFVIFFSGEVPYQTPQNATAVSGFTQFLHALKHPYWNRIGKPLIY